MNPSIHKSIIQIGHTLTRRSPTILTGLGVAGVITTTILAIKATPIALDLMDEAVMDKLDKAGTPMDGVTVNWDLDLSISEKVQAIWKCYIPTVVMAGVTITCIIAANRISARRNAALISLFTIAQEAAREYQAKVIETIGEKKEELIRGEIAQDRLNNDPVDEKTIIISNDGNTLCYDKFSGRYFKSDIEKIRRVVNEFNRDLLIEDYRNINAFYDSLSLDPIDMGEWMGWRIDEGMMDIQFSAKVAENGIPCLVLDYRVQPIRI